ncbi:histidine phosphatase family protein [Nonomuraea sp. NPDC004702]
MTTIFLVRHARTDSNSRGRYMGWIDEGIDPAEAQAAAAVARHLSNKKISTIYASPLLRARQTGRPLAERLNLEIVTHEGFGEMRMGVWEGMTQSAIAEKYPSEWRIWRNDPARLTLPGRETLDAVQRRVAQAMDDISKIGDDIVAVFTHDVVVRLAVLHVLGAPASFYRRIAADNCAINIVHYGRSKQEILLLNDTCHLSRE